MVKNWKRKIKKNIGVNISISISSLIQTADNTRFTNQMKLYVHPINISNFVTSNKLEDE